MSRQTSVVLDHVELWRNKEDSGVYLTVRDERIEGPVHEVVVYVSPRLAAHQALAVMLGRPPV